MNSTEKNDFKDRLHYPIDIKEQQKILDNSIGELADQFIKSNTVENREFLSYLTAAIYLTYKELYPNLSIYIPFRIKSDHSFMQNIKKEIPNSIEKLSKEDVNNLEDLFDTEKISDDISAATIVLDHLKTSDEKNLDYSNELIDELSKKRSKNLFFIENLESRLKDGFTDEEEYYSIKRELLERLVDSTYPEFTLERTIPYSTELEKLDNIYQEKLETANFSSSISKYQTEDLNLLIKDLKFRLSDKLEYEILRETLPVVLNSPLLKALNVKAEFKKDSKKPNGFAAIYYELNTPFGKVELQAQPNQRYYEAKKGSAFHSGVAGKQFNIDSFFELSNPKDDKPLDFYLKKLNAIPVDSLVSDIEVPKFNSEQEKKEFLRTPEGHRYMKSEKIKELANHIIIKDTMHFSDNHSSDTDSYLFGLAKFISPYMNVCSSGHTSFSTASIHQKNLVGEFSEVLRRRDSTTYLGNMLIERLKNILSTKGIKDSSYQKMVQDSLSLPREISKHDIIEYIHTHKDILEKNHEQDIEK